MVGRSVPWSEVVGNGKRGKPNHKHIIVKGKIWSFYLSELLVLGSFFNFVGDFFVLVL